MKYLEKNYILFCCICLLITCKNNQQDGKNPDAIETYTVTPDHAELLSSDLEPLETPESSVRKSVNIAIGYGGIVVSWENPTKAEIGVRLMVKDDGRMIEKEMYFSSKALEKRAFRGFESVETSFALTFEDKWGNISDTVYFTGTPILEVEVPKPWSDLRAMIPYDNTSELSGYQFYKTWDNVVAMNNRYLSDNGSMGSSVTFDLRQVVKLSRMILWPRILGQFDAIEEIYGQVQMLEFEMWGIKKLDPSRLPPTGNKSYWLHPFSVAQTGQTLPAHTFMNDWVYLGRHQVERLDLMGASLEDIAVQGRAGFHFEISNACGPVRIIRLFPIATMDGTPPPMNYWQIAELSFFGDNTVPQD